MQDAHIQPERVSALTGHHFRYYDFVMAAFVAVLLLSNVIGAAKPSVINVGGSEWVFGAGILFFPLGYVIGDVLTEVYGYARAPCHLGGLCGPIVHGFYELGRCVAPACAGLGRAGRI